MCKLKNNFRIWRLCKKGFFFLNGFNVDVIIGHNRKKLRELINELKHFERVEN